jgi:hypothetical protein
VTLFAGAADAIVTGAALSAGTVALVAPMLWLASPTLTDSGVSRTGIEYARDIRRGVHEITRGSVLDVSAVREAISR